MTKKRYLKTPHASRSAVADARPPQRPLRSARYPFPRRYCDLQGDEEHPIDAVIARIPAIAALDRKLLRQSHVWESQVRDAEAYRDYEDARLRQRCLREEAFFDGGHREGRLVGLVESLSASIAGSQRAGKLARQIRTALLTTILPPDRIVAVLLELARAIALGQQLPAISSRERR
jgi:hypothetical protein